MNVSGESRAWANRNESVLILLLCVAAAIRVLIFSAAFPFFSNIDEDLHFDLVTQYSHARLPQSFARLQEETLNWIVPYASPEFLFTADRFPEGTFLSPVCFGALFLCGLQWLRTNRPTFLLSALTGLAIAATYLTKLSNLPLVVMALVAIIAKLAPSIRQKSKTTLLAFVTLILCAAIPIGSWIVWTKYQFGDLTGSATKITLLGWTHKPFVGWWHHPIFTLRGFWVFWWNLIASFWRGEVKWHGQLLNCPVADDFYTISTLVLLGAALLGLRKKAGLSTFERQAIAIAALSFIAAVGFLALLSIQFDFGNCINPSRAHPYFTSGRLLSGALIPFALFYVYGISWILRRINSALPILVLGILLLFVITSEIKINRAAFESEHNWFHL